MNYRGSYRRLLANARAAMVAAIEIYNKPLFPYRNECFVILLLNAWELGLKAILSKNAKTIFYPKKRSEPYRTLSLTDALTRSGQFFPKSIPELAVRRNIELIRTYRDNSVHFYNAPGFGAVIYLLAQTSIKNFRDLLSHMFGVRLEDDINWHLLPLGISPPVDPVAYMAGRAAEGGRRSRAVDQFLSELAAAASEVASVGADTGRLLTVFTVKLESVKKISDADVLVGIQSGAPGNGPLAIIRGQDPNVTHPLRQKEVLSEITEVHGVKLTSHVFQAILWKYRLKEDRRYCWKAKEGVLTKYSNDLIPYIRALTKTEVASAVSEYRAYLRTRTQNAARSG